MKNQLIPAKKATNRTNVFINKNFIIRVIENPKECKKSVLTSASKLSNFIKDEELKIKLFNKVLASPKDKVTFMIRNRLKIDFCSKQLLKKYKMKLKNRFKIIANHLLIWFLCFAIVSTTPLQFLDGKNRIWKNIENKIFKTFFINDDLRKNI